MPATVPDWDWDAWIRQAAERLEKRKAERDAERLEREIALWGSRAAYERVMEHVRKLVDEAPPLSDEQKARLRPLLSRSNPNPYPAAPPRRPQQGTRSVNPKPGTLYGKHLRAADGACGHCGEKGPREVDHCRDHLVVRGLVCRNCSALAEQSMSDTYRATCEWCAWDIWLATELAR